MKNKIIYIKNKISRVILILSVFVNLWSLIFKRNFFCNLLSMILSNPLFFICTLNKNE